ncbi:hypothetical protein [Roseomonas chloroacetimidivorans]|uniref:hypothetical protein n=1 Tax=Roseomonas chloroacetimidivorans TaxID=1766656 RepID=UPI003C7778D1
MRGYQPTMPQGGPGEPPHQGTGGRKPEVRFPGLNIPMPSGTKPPPGLNMLSSEQLKAVLLARTVCRLAAGMEAFACRDSIAAAAEVLDALAAANVRTVEPKP